MSKCLYSGTQILPTGYARFAYHHTNVWRFASKIKRSNFEVLLIVSVCLAVSMSFRSDTELKIFEKLQDGWSIVVWAWTFWFCARDLVAPRELSRRFSRQSFLRIFACFKISFFTKISFYQQKRNFDENHEHFERFYNDLRKKTSLVLRAPKEPSSLKALERQICFVWWFNADLHQQPICDLLGCLS